VHVVVHSLGARQEEGYVQGCCVALLSSSCLPCSLIRPYCACSAALLKRAGPNAAAANVLPGRSYRAMAATAGP
jgi:hypothetical protein